MTNLSLIPGIFLSLSFPLVIGHAALGMMLRFPFLTRSAQLALSYVLGMGITAYVLLALSWASIPLSCANVLVALSVLALILSLLSRKLQKDFPFSPIAMPATSQKSGTLKLILNMALFAIIMIAMCYVLSLAFAYPIYAYDSLYLEAIRAKIFFFHRSIAMQPFTSEPAFPLQASLAMLWTATCIHQWHDKLLILPFAAIFTAFMTLNYFFLKRFTNRLWAKIGLLLLCSSPLLILHGTLTYRDIWMATTNVATLGLLLSWIDEKRTELIVAAGIYAGLGTFVKNEGTPYFLVFTVITLLIALRGPFDKQRIIKFFSAFFIPAILILLIYWIYKFSHAIPVNGSLAFTSLTTLCSRLGHICEMYFDTMLFRPNWNILWPMMIITALAYAPTFLGKLKIRLAGIALCLLLTVIFMTAAFTNKYQELTHPFTFSRVFLHFLFIAVWIIVLIHHAHYPFNDE